eukprot:5350652-Pyramimonas_sp.AAC.2
MVTQSWKVVCRLFRFASFGIGAPIAIPKVGIGFPSLKFVVASGHPEYLENKDRVGYSERHILRFLEHLLISEASVAATKP